MFKPLIGITSDYYSSNPDQPNLNLQGAPNNYIAAVVRAGGLPVLVPLSLAEADLRDLYARLQGILVPGGGDVDPQLFGAPRHSETHEVVPDRDRTELALMKRAADDGKPLFGICRGVQVLNVALGGTLWQDLPSELAGPLQHYAPAGAPGQHIMHSVRVEEESLLARLLGQPIVDVNSRHHQALKEVAPGLEVVARAPDGVIEAVALTGHPFALGVQWHPENFPERVDMRALFDGFVAAAAK